MILGADGSVRAHLVLLGPPAPSGWCADVPDGAGSSVSNPVSNLDGSEPSRSRPVDVPPVLDPEHGDLMLLLDDPERDPVGPPPGRPDAGKLPAERLAHPAWLLDLGGREESNHHSRDRFGKPVSSARRAGAVRTSSHSPRRSPLQGADSVHPPHDVTAGVARVGLTDVRECLRVGQHRQRLLKLSQVLRADQHRGRPAVTGDRHPLVLLLYSLHNLGQVIPDCSVPGSLPLPCGEER